MSESDLEYFRRRHAEELAELERSEDEQVRQVHRELADKYLSRIRQIEGGGASWGGAVAPVPS